MDSSDLHAATLQLAQAYEEHAAALEKTLIDAFDYIVLIAHAKWLREQAAKLRKMA